MNFEEKIIAAVKAGCNELEKKSKCGYPNCTCQYIPRQILAAIKEFQK